MTVKTIILHRIKNDRLHKTILSKPVRMHIDILDQLFERALKWGMVLEIDEIIDSIVEKY